MVRWHADEMTVRKGWYISENVSYILFSCTDGCKINNGHLLCSTELMRRVRRFQIAQYNCLVIKYAKDTRYSEKGMATHDK